MCSGGRIRPDSGSAGRISGVSESSKSAQGGFGEFVVRMRGAGGSSGEGVLSQFVWHLIPYPPGAPRAPPGAAGTLSPGRRRGSRSKSPAPPEGDLRTQALNCPPNRGNFRPDGRGVLWGTNFGLIQEVQVVFPRVRRVQKSKNQPQEELGDVVGRLRGTRRRSGERIWERVLLSSPGTSSCHLILLHLILLASLSRGGRERCALEAEFRPDSGSSGRLSGCRDLRITLQDGVWSRR